MSLLDAALQRVRDVLAPSRGDRDLREEITHHLELETARHIRAGCDPAIARARALARFGNPTIITEATRDERGGQPVESTMQDLAWAFRSLRKSAGFTALALTTLAVGIGATTVAFTVLDTVLLRPLPFHDANRLVYLRERTDKQDLLPPSYPNFVSWRDQARSFDAVVSATFPSLRTVWPGSSAAEAVRVPALGVSRRFFTTLGVPLAAGREFTDDEDSEGGAPAVMVSYEFWQSKLGGRLPLGTVRYGDRATPVVGVAPPNFRFVAPADIYFPNERYPGTIRSAHSYMVVGRLKPGLTIGAARADMTALSKRLRAEFGTDTQAADADVMPLRDYLVADYRVMLTIVFGAASLVLLIACTNLISAQLARGRSREHEIVVRSALGASKARLVRQLLLESGVLVAGGTALGIALALAATVFVRTVGANLVPRLVELHVDGRVLAFVALVATITALLVGVYPALRLAGREAGLVLRTRTAGMTVRRSVWRVLIGFEIALAVVLLVGSALLIRTLHNILAADTGFDSRGIVTMAISSSDEDAPRLFQALDDIRGLPGVEGAAFTNHLPLQWGSGSAPLRRPGDPPDRDWPAMAGFRVVGTDYFAVLRQPVLEGRAFTPADRDGAAEVAIITAGIAAKLWPGQNPIGKTIATNYLSKDWLTVVGVVAEASSWSQPRGAQNEIYVPLAQHPKSVEGQLIAMIRTAGSPTAAIPMLRGRLRQLLPTSPAEIGTMDERIARSAADRRFAMLALTAFGAVALLLAAIGIYGVIWYIVTTRTHEIGIRMALGATAGRVRTEVLSGAAAMAAGGIIAGIAGGAFATRYLQATLYGVSRLDPRTYLLGALIALATAMLAAYLPARRSSHVDPVIAMRGE